MGNQYIIQQAVDDANYDMYNRVQPAVEALSAAFKKVQPLLDHGTWSGPAAEKWIREWMSQYKAVLKLLGDMPGAERKVVSDARAHAEATVSKMNRQQRH